MLRAKKQHTPQRMLWNPPAAFRRSSTLRRSFSLLQKFPQERTHPDKFYSFLAEDTVQQIQDLLHIFNTKSLSGLRVLDIGGADGFFSRAFHRHTPHYYLIDTDTGLIPQWAATKNHAHGVIASGTQLPFSDNSFDIVYASNVLEHTPEPWRMADEMLRVCAPSGLVYLSYTNWKSPFGGHETGMRHYISGGYAARHYHRKTGHEPKNLYGYSLFRCTHRDGLDWARWKQYRGDADFLLAYPRYNPWWSWWMSSIPGISEYLTANTVIALTPR